MVDPPPRGGEIFALLAHTEQRREGKHIYTVYMIDVRFRGKHWQLHKRYSQFADVNERLRMQFPMYDGIFKTFPPKRLRSMKAQLIETRRHHLQDYLQRILAVDCMVASLSLLNFLQLEDQFVNLSAAVAAAGIGQDSSVAGSVAGSMPSSHQLEFPSDRSLDRFVSMSTSSQLLYHSDFAFYHAKFCPFENPATCQGVVRPMGAMSPGILSLSPTLGSSGPSSPQGRDLARRLDMLVNISPNSSTSTSFRREGSE